MVEGHREIHQVVLESFNGSICGEHGDGRVRAEVVRQMFGEDLYQLFVRVKETLNPSGIFNPGVKISDIPLSLSTLILNDSQSLVPPVLNAIQSVRSMMFFSLKI